MKKTILILALFIGLLITSSGFNKTSLNTAIGKEAPQIPSLEIQDVIKQSEKEGTFVLLSFWSASDGVSRMTINNYNTWLDDNNDAKLNLVALNFDKSSALFNEIVRRDGLQSEWQFNVAGELARKIKNEYHLDDGYGSLLIAPDGKIVAHNPSSEVLADYTQNHFDGAVE